MNAVAHDSTSGDKEPGMIKTTLYDLIDAISTDLTNEEDELVIATVVYLIQSGRIRFLKNLQQHN
jgi:hypothetical protein